MEHGEGSPIPHALVHPWTEELFGLVVFMDTMIYVWIPMVVLLVAAVVVRIKLSLDTPGKLQIMMEGLFDFIGSLVRDSLGDYGRKVIPPLAFTLFLFIFLASFLELIPAAILMPSDAGGFEWVPFKAATGDVNVPLALGLFVIVLIHFYSIKAKGIAGYVGSYFVEPITREGVGIPKKIWPFVAVLVFGFNFILRMAEEVGKIISLPMRLFGNMFAKAIIFFLIGLIGSAGIFGPLLMLPADIFWRGWSTMIVVIQAFVFALLAIVYTKLATVNEHDSEGGEH